MSTSPAEDSRDYHTLAATREGRDAGRLAGYLARGVGSLVRNVRKAAPIVLAALLAESGCTVDAGDLGRWQRAKDGPSKIRGVLSDPDRTVDLRAAAVLALVEIGNVDEVIEDLLALQVDDSRRVVDRAAPELLRWVKGVGPPGARKESVHAKDVLFAIRERLTPIVRRAAELAIVDWLCEDLAGRAKLGKNGADPIVTALQTAAALPLIRLLAVPGTDVAEVARLLLLIDYPSVRPKAADVLVARARRELPPREVTFLAMGRIGGARAAAYLADTAGAQGPARVWALRALRASPHASAIAAVERIAGDRSRVGDQAAREEAFGVLQEATRGGDDGARRALLGFIGDADDKVRWRAIGALVDSDDARGLAQLLDALPASSLGMPAELRDHVLAPLARKGAVTLPTLRAALQARSPAGRLVAARLLGDLGTVEDKPRLEALRSDRARLRGGSGLPTVGAEAQAAAQRLSARLR